MVQFVGFLVWAFVMYCISAFFVEQLKAGYISGLYLCIVWFGANLYMLIDMFIISTIKERREYRKWMEEEPKRMQELRDSVIADGKKLILVSGKSCRRQHTMLNPRRTKCVVGLFVTSLTASP